MPTWSNTRALNLTLVLRRGVLRTMCDFKGQREGEWRDRVGAGKNRGRWSGFLRDVEGFSETRSTED